MKITSYRIFDKITNVEVDINLDSIERLTVWHNLYGNPSYGIYTKDGKKYISIDDYGICRELHSYKNVKRKKDL